MKNQLFLIAVFVTQFIYNYLPFFFLKKKFFQFCGNKLGKDSFVHTRVKFFTIGKITIGDNTTINSDCYLDARKGINIGNNVNIAHGVKIYSLGHDIDDPYLRSKGETVIIKDNSFIFPFAMIMPGITIEEGAVVYPGAVVVKNVKPYQIVGGNPARHLRYRKKDIQYRLNYSQWFAL